MIFYNCMCLCLYFKLVISIILIENIRVQYKSDLKKVLIFKQIIIFDHLPHVHVHATIYDRKSV